MESDNGDCCKVPENLVLETCSDLTTALVKSMRCKICGRHHYRMTVKPIVIDLSSANK